jgi:hypothetical protein
MDEYEFKVGDEILHITYDGQDDIKVGDVFPGYTWKKRHPEDDSPEDGIHQDYRVVRIESNRDGFGGKTVYFMPVEEN